MGVSSRVERMLVLTSSTGGGHDSRARALAAWVQELTQGAVEVRIERIIENASWLGRFGVDLYNLIQRRVPWMHQIYWHIVERFIGAQADTVTIGGRYYRQLLSDWQPQWVVSVHDSTNRGYFQDARRVLGEVRTATYCGEWSGGAGYSANWVEPTVDLFAARTAVAADYAVRLGLAPERVLRVQNFFPPGFPALTAASASRSGRPTLLLAASAQGANQHLRVLRALAHLALPLRIIAVCGRDERALRLLQRWKAAHPQVELEVEGYSTRMPELLAQSDWVLTRGGANTAAEACQAGCVPIFHAFGGMMPQERLTVDYFLEAQAGRLVRRIAELPPVLADLLAHPEQRETLRRALLALRQEDSTALFVRALLAGHPSLLAPLPHVGA